MNKIKMKYMQNENRLKVKCCFLAAIFSVVRVYCRASLSNEAS